LLVLTGKSDVQCDSLKIGPVLVFRRLGEEAGLSVIFKELLSDRKYEFDVELTVSISVLHHLFTSGSDRSCEKWMTDYRIKGTETLSLHHFYRAMAFLGSPLEDQSGNKFLVCIQLARVFLFQGDFILRGGITQNRV